MPFGQPRRHYRTTDSTNDRARELAAAGAPGGTVVTATEQIAGRGRQGRTWSSPGGSLISSFVLRPLDERHSLLPLAVPLAVCEAIEAVGPASCQVKWPNDVWIDERKVAGILIEARPAEGWAVIGVGVNVGIDPSELPPEVRETAASIPGGEVEELLRELYAKLGAWSEAEPSAILTEFGVRDALRGRTISWHGAGDAGSGEGTADGVGEDGNLLVLTEDGEHLNLGAGEVHLRVG